MPTINVVNLKCGGCEASVKKSLEKLGATDVVVSASTQTVSFKKGDQKLLTKKLAQMGYPEASSKKAKSILKKAQSYLSCMIGKVSSKTSS